MNLPELPLVVLDTETTGFVPRVHRIIEFASMKIIGGKPCDEFETLCGIPGEIPEQITALTRIRTEDVHGKPSFEERRSDILQHIGDDTIIVGQNVGFDIGMLKGEGIDLTDRPYIDTSMLASMVFPEFESYSLGYMSGVLDLDHTPMHRALGDVRATTQLLAACWKRFCELPDAEYEQLQAVMERSPEGYRTLFGALPAPAANGERPTWLKPIFRFGSDKGEGKEIDIPNPGTVQLIESPINDTLAAKLCSRDGSSSGSRWIAVKNLHAFLRRFAVPEEMRCIHPPLSCLSREATAELLGKESLSDCEATLAVKLQWYVPRFMHECPLHGDEKNLWSGTLSCTWQSPEYREQFDDVPSSVLIDHRQLLGILADEEHPGHAAVRAAEHIVIDDASMLEDTSTKAYGWYCSIDDLRPAALSKTFGQFVDTLQLWIEKLRRDQDVRYIAPSDLKSKETEGLRSLLESILPEASGPAFRQLTQLQWILDPDELPGRIAWIERRIDGGQMLQSVPERIGESLREELYDTVPTTLLIPPGSAQTLHEVLPEGTPTVVIEAEGAASLSLELDAETSLWKIFDDDRPLKTVVLVSSKRIIESVFVRLGEQLEARGVTLICQGFSGGTGRMQAEFAAAAEPVFWVMTPWMFEGIELPAGDVDRLVIEKIPFDHPSQTVLSKRAEHYRNPFDQYSLPRALHRLYRILRTFRTYSSANAEITVLDDRLKTKSYGAVVARYLTTLTQPQNPTPPGAEKDQLSLFR